MGQEIIKKFAALRCDVMCECKSISTPLDSTRDFHNHDGHEILLVLNGIMNLYTEAGGVKLERGDLACVHEYDFHRGELVTKERYDRIVINIRENRFARLQEACADLDSCFPKYPSSPLRVMHLKEHEIEEMEEYAQALQESLAGKRPGDGLVADAYLKLILVMILRRSMEWELGCHAEIMPQLVVETFSYIEEHLTQEITLKKLEEHIHHSGTYISRCFKRITGISLQQFILAKKITLSCRLLREGYAPGEVCYMTGFNNYSNYSRTFSKQMGLSPKKYQMMSR